MSDEIEKIIVELETQGANSAYIVHSRTNDALGKLTKQKGPESLAKSFDDVAAAAARAKAATDQVGPLRDERGRFLPRGTQSFPRSSTDGLADVETQADGTAAAFERALQEYERFAARMEKKHTRNQALEAARKEAHDFADQMRASNRIPTELQAASNPKAIDFAAALEAQSRKAGSAIEAAAHSAMEEAVAIGEAAKNASKLSSVYDVIERRAKAAAKADADWLADRMRAANRIPTHLMAGANPKALTGGQKAFQTFSRTFGPRATQGLVSSVEALEKIGPIAGKIGPPLASAAIGIGALTVAGAGLATMAGVKFGKAVVRVQGFREDMVTALEAITGTEAKANAVIDRAASTADFLRKKRGETVGQFTSLMSKGFDVDTSDKLIRAMADMKVKAPQAKTDEMLFAIGQIRSKGKLQGEELMQLNEAGLDRGKFMSVLGQQAGKTAAEMDKLISAGKVSYDVFEKAFFGTLKPEKGVFGELAQKKARNNINGLIEQLHDIPDNIFFDVKAGTGMDGVKNTLNSIIDWFDVNNGKGKEVRKVAGDLFNAMIEGLTGEKVDTKKGITGTLDAMLAGAKEAVPVVRELAGGARELMGIAGGIAGAVGTFSEWTGGIGNIGSAWRGLTLPARVLMAPLTGGLSMLPELYQGIRGIGALLDGDTKGAMERFKNMLPGGAFLESFVNSTSGAIESLVSSIRTGAANMFESGMAYGRNLWQGLVQGIQSGIGVVVQSATNLANAALGAVGSTWRVGSPAQAFADLSVWAGPGMARGFRRGTRHAVSAAEYMAMAALSASATAPANMNGNASALAMSGGSGPSVVIHFSPQIIVSGASSPAQAQAIGGAAVRGAREQFEAQLGTGLRRLAYG
ncbi:MAG: tape measure protein [Polyangiaceae bacterium]|nr:tape measure protein [Polyangiaceae bacterium]